MSDKSTRTGPVLIDLEADAESSQTKKTRKTASKSGVKPDGSRRQTTLNPASAPPVPDLDMPADASAPEGRAMRVLASLAGRKPSRLVRFFWMSLVALLGFAASLAAWDFVTGLLDRSPILGWTASGLFGLVVFFLLLISGRELLALGRLKRMDKMRSAADAAMSEHSLSKSKAVANRVLTLYANRRELTSGREKARALIEDQFEADAVLSLVEQQVIAPLDRAAILEIEAAARQVAAVTAIVPLALADLIAALTANLRMIRRIAEIYGGRSGTLGSWRLTRAVLTHLVATGAVAVGDDLIGSVAGGGIMSRLSRRFGEGIINGALTARVGVAAMDVCRPVPFLSEKRPSVTGLVKRALVGLFPSGT